MSHDLRDLAAVLDSDYPLDRAAKKILNAADEIERLREALREYENSDNWFDTSDEAGGPYPAWRGPFPNDPEGFARRALRQSETDDPSHRNVTLEGGGEDG